MNGVRRVLTLLGAAALAATLTASSAGAQAVTGSYIYTLSGFTGPIPYNHARVAVDAERNEVYVLYQSTIRVFNDTGMEVYRFGDDLGLGLMIDVAIDERGDIIILAYRDNRPVLVRCDYRGRPQSEMWLTGLPKELAEFKPNRMAYQRGQLFLVSLLGLHLVVADAQGRFVKGYDLFRLFDLQEKDRDGVEISGFSVDRDGNVLMTVPVLFRAFVLAPDGTMNYFGKSSSAPGGFNIAGGIGRDSKGNFVVIDKLKGSLQVFGRNFAFVSMFSTRGHKPGQLAFPDDLVIDGRDRVYVTQMGRRGISVFTLAYR